MGKTTDMRVRFYLFCLQQTPPQSDDNSPPGAFTEETLALPGPGEKNPVRPFPHGAFAGEVSREPQPICRPNGAGKGLRRNSAAAVHPGGASLSLAPWLPNQEWTDNGFMKRSILRGWRIW